MTTEVDLSGATSTRPSHRSGSTPSRHRPAGTSLLVSTAPGAVLALVFTAWHYSSKPLWRDEWYTLSTADRPFTGMLEIVKGPDVGLAGFYGVMHLWLLVDDSVWWLRLPSAAATVALSVVTALLARRLAGTAAGVVSGLLVATLPPVFAHAQEARAYPLVLLTTTLTALLMLRYRDSPTAHRGWWLAGVAALPGCLHPIVGLPAVAGLFLGAVIAPGRAKRARLVVVSSPAAVGGLLLVAAGFRQQVGSATPPPVAPGALSELPRSLAGPLWMTVLLWVLASVGLLIVARRHRATDDQGTWILLVCWLLAPLVVVSGMGLGGSFFRARYVSDAAPVFAVLAAIALTEPLRTAVSRLWVLAAAAIVLVVLTRGSLAMADVRDQGYYSDDPRSAAAALAAGARPGDAVVYTGRTARGMTTYYLPRGTPVEDALMTRTPMESQSIEGQEVAADQRSSALSAYERVWVVGATLGGELSDSTKVADVTEGRRQVDRTDYGGFRVELWASPPSS